MSSFFSNKYLRLRALESRGIRTSDLPCARCGHNLRGIPFTSACPECGAAPHDVEQELSGSGPVTLLAVPQLRHRIANGLLLLLFSAVLTPALYGVQFVAANVAADWSDTTGRLLLLGNDALWCLGAFIALPWSLQSVPGLRWLNTVRWPIIVSQAMFPIVSLVLLIRGVSLLNEINPSLLTLLILMKLCAGVGMIVLLFMLVEIARHLDLDHPVTRLRTGAGGLAILGFLMGLFSGSFAWFMLFWLILCFVLWTISWLMAIIGMHHLRSAMVWQSRHLARQDTRAERVAAQRSELDSAVHQGIRSFSRTDHRADRRDT